MPPRTSDVCLSENQVQELSEQIKSVFRSRSNSTAPFTKTKGSPVYEELKDLIYTYTGVYFSTSTLRNLLTGSHNGRFRNDTHNALTVFILKSMKNNYDENINPDYQRIFWGVNHNLPPGAFIERTKGEFISWEQLKKELDNSAINQCPRIIPVGSQVVLAPFYGKDDWLVNIINTKGETIGSVWIGGDPYNNWNQDGLVRVGKTISDTEWEVYQVLARYPDASYRIVKSFV
ncbi:MAG: hypothetical protein IBJ09_11760 [Bacteroidia bacterium]|nr:hypothetical protein [Bacteroidia bacterium]